MNIVVTGASRGIGYELVKLYSANANYTIIALARSEKKLQKLKEECELINPTSKVIIIPYDLTSNNLSKDVIEEITKHISSINILINNAGAIINRPFQNITIEEMEYVYKVNVFSVIRLTQALLPIMGLKERSHIVNISSMGGFQGSAKFAGLSVYSSSKAALACLTECLAEELKEKNITVNCLALGATQTEMLNEAFPGYKAPLSAKEMASYVANFSLNAHHFINGKILPVSMSTP
ncbi:MAG: SDR family oxidoreductase [Bacteroidia bacterium]